MGLSNHLYKSRKTYKGITKLHKMWRRLRIESILFKNLIIEVNACQILGSNFILFLR